MCFDTCVAFYCFCILGIFMSEPIENIENKEKILEDKKNKLKEDFNLIEMFFINKKNFIEKFKHIPVEEIIQNSPKYYSFIRIIEQINSFVSKDNNWLKKFLNGNGVSFDWEQYSKWKSGVDFIKINYNDTFAPVKWINFIQDKLIEILKSLQILLYMECYIDEEDFKKFLKKHPEIDYKIRANFMTKSLPSENLNQLFEIIDYLIRINIENDMATKFIVDTRVCMRAYRKIDELKIFDILKRKEFYIKFRTQYLEMSDNSHRSELPYESDIIEVANCFLGYYKDIVFGYKEYKERLIEKFDKIKNRVKT